MPAKITRPLIVLFIAIISCCAANAQTDTISKLPAGDTTEREAYFPGGEEAWKQFLADNVDHSTPVKKRKNQAPVGKYTVWVQFIVDKDGSIINIKALTAWGYGMEEEVMRVIAKSPKWVPAFQFGRHVKAFRKQPLTFTVEEEPAKKKKG
jgi:hypothetical protein